MDKKVISTISLAGCFGCHMSFLDIDLKLLELIELVEFNRSPLTDIKTFSKRIDIGIIEGGCSNDENVKVLKDFRKNCDILISLGECAIMGGLPALRNHLTLKECLEEAYFNVPTSNHNQTIPRHEDLPQLLDKVYPCHELVKIDYFLPGCPPSGEIIWQALAALIKNDKLEISKRLIKYD
ncbi:MAG: NADP oxidoreductase [Bacteriovoracaceae bacterium]|nr:NADP oxidoreductase [Bacteriovoracaceae bacterium]